ncbi:MAG: Uma2 family endonuclease [Gemmataceae bacterium]
MSTSTFSPALPLLSGDEFLRQHGGERGLELVRGIVRRKELPGARHGLICQRLSFHIGLYLETNEIGYLLTNDTFVRTEQFPESFRGPDLQFFSYARMPKGTVPTGVPDVAPNLVIEVRSPSETMKSLLQKAVEYLDANVNVVVLIDPDERSATVVQSDGNPHVMRTDQTLTFPGLLPGFALPLNILFE